MQDSQCSGKAVANLMLTHDMQQQAYGVEARHELRQLQLAFASAVNMFGNTATNSHQCTHVPTRMDTHCSTTQRQAMALQQDGNLKLTYCS